MLKGFWKKSKKKYRRLPKGHHERIKKATCAHFDDGMSQGRQGEGPITFLLQLSNDLAAFQNQQMTQDRKLKVFKASKMKCLVRDGF